MVSLAKLWRECGVRPAAVVGHSQGEIAAAHIAGALSLEDAALIIAERGKAMAKIAGKGGMLSVSLTPEALTPYTEPYGERVSLAAINGPASLVLSGDPEALKEIQAPVRRDEVRAKPIAVDYAAHSAQIEALREELLEAFAPISPQSARDPPALHGHRRADRDRRDGSPSTGTATCARRSSWSRSCAPCSTRASAPSSRSDPTRSSASAPRRRSRTPSTIQARRSCSRTLRREEDEAERFALSLAQAHAQGIAVDWEAFFKGSGAKRVPLPTYPFQRQRYWLCLAAPAPPTPARSA